MMGRRRVMEDAVTVAPPMRLAGEYSFFGVYDGHGGSSVAEKCSERLHECLQRLVEAARSLPGGKCVDWEEAMVDCFARMDEEVAEKEVGSTAVVVLVGKEEVVVGNCGDSRAVLCRDGVPVPLSSDHKPDRPDETRRVEAAGGRITKSDGWLIQGLLTTSRAIGDHYLKTYVISKPEVTVHQRTDLDSFLIIATAALWTVLSNELACEIVSTCLGHGIRVRDESEAEMAAAALAELAIAKGSKDNISIIVVQLK